MNSVLKSNIRNGRSPFENRIITIDKLADMIAQSDAPLILYGAGATCPETLKSLFAARILPVCITDSDPSKANTHVMQIPVLSPEEAINKAGSQAICAVGIWSIATFYKPFLNQLESLGYQNVYFLHTSLRPRSLPENWVKDVQNNEVQLLNALERFVDEKSKERFEDFIYSFLSSKLDHCNVLGRYKARDGEILHNDLIDANKDDVLVHCHCGFQDESGNYLGSITHLKQAFLFEPTWTGRVKTKEYFYTRESDCETMVLPYLLSDRESEIAFKEKIFFNRFIDQEEYKPAKASAIPLDQFVNEVKPTILYLDMTGGHIEALMGARQIVEEHKPTIVLSGFQFASEVVEIMNHFPLYRYSMRYFGGNTMREGYVLFLESEF